MSKQLKPEEILDDYFVYMGCSDVDRSQFNGAMLATSVAYLSEQTIEPPEFFKRMEMVSDIPYAQQLDGKLYLARMTRTERFLIKDRRIQKDIDDIRHDAGEFGNFYRYHSAHVLGDGSVASKEYIVAHSPSTNGLTVVSPSQSRQALDIMVSLGGSYRENKKRILNILNARTQAIAKSFDTICMNLTLAKLAWTCRVTTEGLSVILYCDPTGVQNLWRLRDIPSGAKRRAALLHWVSEHWRQNRIDPDVEGYVRKHLRGQNECTQGGMKIEIIPSQTDMQANEQAASDRIDMRKFRRDRRKRLEKAMANGKS